MSGIIVSMRVGRRWAMVSLVGVIALTGCGSSGEADADQAAQATGQDQSGVTSGEADEVTADDRPGGDPQDGDASDDTEALDAFAVDICALLTIDQVESATGANAQPPELLFSDDAGGSCSWTLDAATVSYVQLQVRTDTPASAFREQFGDDAVDVDLPGASEAFQTSFVDARMPSTLTAQAGDFFVQVIVIRTDDPAAAALTLAEQAVAALG